jgi:acetyl-CoA carboxylase biotin carboxylase subunit
MSVRRVLVANRGEIAVRIIRTCQSLGLQTVLAASDVDRDSTAARMADRTVVIGPGPATRSYLDPSLVLHAARATGCDALHPGYGFLSERAELAQACLDNDIVFIGPTPATIAQLGDKVTARALAEQAGARSVPGSPALADAAAAADASARIGFPVLLKAAAGGGGRGMAVVHTGPEAAAAFDRLTREARDAFGDGTLYLERFVPMARHVEVQVVGDGNGGVLVLGLRDCSVQRRYQKVVEEAPAPALSPSAAAALVDGAVALLSRVGYRGAGTVEFLYDVARDEVYFIEVNTRIQVEHPVTEAVTGLDVVALQLAVAQNETLPSPDEVTSRGHAIEFRVNAEDPANDLRPTPGRIERWQLPSGPGVRVDTHCAAGTVISPYYDSLLAKLIVHGQDRDEAVARAAVALADFEVTGIPTNLPLLRAICAHPDFVANRVHTRWLESTLADFPEALLAVPG